MATSTSSKTALPGADATVELIETYAVGQVVHAAGVALDQGTTSPPPRYSEDTLIRDMENAWRFARTPEERAMLKQTEGIGTARTRGPTLENLLRRQLLSSKKNGKRHELISSEIGRQMVGRLPIWLTDVATTAKWEMLLTAIEKGDVNPRDVVRSQTEHVKQVVDRAKSQVNLAGKPPA